MYFIYTLCTTSTRYVLHLHVMYFIYTLCTHSEEPTPSRRKISTDINVVGEILNMTSKIFRIVPKWIIQQNVLNVPLHVLDIWNMAICMDTPRNIYMLHNIIRIMYCFVFFCCFFNVHSLPHPHPHPKCFMLKQVNDADAPLVENLCSLLLHEWCNLTGCFTLDGKVALMWFSVWLTLVVHFNWIVLDDTTWFIIGYWMWNILTPHFHFPLELYVYMTLTNNYLAFFIYQIIILWTISLNWHRWLLVNNHISKYNSFILVLYRRYINYLSVSPPPPPPPRHTHTLFGTFLRHWYIYISEREKEREREREREIHTYIHTYIHTHIGIHVVSN